MKKTLEDLDFNNKKVLVRCDFNVPLISGEISDDNRIIQALPTIKYLIEHKAKIVLCSHLGKVKNEEDKLDKSLIVVAQRLRELLNQDVIFINETRGFKLEKGINNLKEGQVLLFENTRFEPLETKNDPELAQYWGSLVDLFVLDAFGSSHRAHASTTGVSKYVKDSCVGLLIEKELAILGKALSNPRRPLVAVIGGAKVSEKIGVIDNLLKIADKIIIGGGMAYTFLKAQGYEIGISLCEDDKVALAQEYLTKAGDKLVLPLDSVCATTFSNDGFVGTFSNEIMKEDLMGLDIGPLSIDCFKAILKDAHTVIWNGPMGVFEMDNYAKGTEAICECIANLKDATTIVGGGDSAAAAKKFGYTDKFTHVSTGGGASLEFMEGKKLPGIESIANK
ncbi:MAG: phosphoglycerate kinase [Bacilli bacterium]|jgi:phosphoglycerate kinase|nr:phosphoglycerate kinase [Bacilli bacterium]